MKLLLVLAVALAAGLAFAEPVTRVGRHPRLNVSPRYKIRKDFAAFDDVYPAQRRQAELRRYTPDAGGAVWFDVYELGRITVRSRRLAAFDPVIFSGGAFARDVEPGQYPVLVAVRHGREPAVEGTTNAVLLTLFARVEVAARPAARWELARFEDDRLNRPDRRGVVGYAVGSGLGAFADAKSREKFAALGRQPDGVEVEDRVAAVHGHRADAPSWAEVNYHSAGVGRLGPFGGNPDADLVRFGSSGGDGRYASYWGFDADGKVVGLMTDFGWCEWAGKPGRGR